MTTERTERLLNRWRSGDRGAGDQLMRRYRPVLRAFFRRKQAANAEELVQSTLAACVQAVGRFAERSSFRTYLMGIARNQFLMSLRSETPTSADPLMLSTAPEESPSWKYAFAQESRLLFRALLRLPPEYRRVLALLYWEGHSVEVISQELGVPVGTVKSRLTRGRAMLRSQLLGLNRPGRPQLSVSEVEALMSTKP
ncbi:MAG TPA: RNA polymerase sigma factor [Polyangiaceae bacterium]|nr:RNA polymerase sigma factor [Polyangiaceae bacterium]